MLDRRFASRQRGLSLVELMVGITIGLFVVAGASLVVATQLGDNRRLLLETQLQQDLRATLDIVTREIRRAGGVADATALAGLWQEGGGPVARNNLATIDLNADLDEVVFRYRRGGNEGPFGFRLSSGVVQSLLGGNWQALTDANVMTVTTFTVTPTPEPAVQIPCPRLCDDGTQSCWPTLAVRAYTVDIAARSRSDPAVQRSVRSQVRLRNDLLEFNDPLHPDRVCPT